MEVCRPPPSPTATPRPRRASCPPQRSRTCRGPTFGIYVHVPFCTVRCGYCDFNTYTLTELGGPGASIGIDLRRRGRARARPRRKRVLGSDGACRVDTVFVGGGTPTMLRPARPRDGAATAYADVSGWRRAPRSRPRPTPTRVTPQALQELRRRRASPASPSGMQSAVPHVLAHPRAHARPRQRRAGPSRAARAAGFAGERRPHLRHPGGVPRRTGGAASRRRSPCGPDHVSAYALVVEEGTKLAAQVRRGSVPAPEDDDEADKYELADELLAAAGFGWYEVSNWARAERHRCRHNVALLGGHELVGSRAGRAQPRRRRALVERQAPQCVCRAAGCRTLARPRPVRP